jgi:SAM-dependent methyltransferase
MKNQNSVAEFWEKNQIGYAGDILAPEIIRLAKKYVNGEVLDAGAGSGALISRLPNAVGIDLAPKDKNIIQGDITKMPFESGRFGAVFATEVLEHLSDDILTASLKEIKRVLKPGGFFIVTVPYMEDIEKNTIECPKCGECFHRWGHLQSFDEDGMTEILENNGFKIIKISALPLGSMARHPFLKYFSWIFKKIGKFQPTNLFVISENV